MPHPNSISMTALSNISQCIATILDKGWHAGLINTAVQSFCCLAKMTGFQCLTHASTLIHSAYGLLQARKKASLKVS